MTRYSLRMADGSMIPGWWGQAVLLRDSRILAETDAQLISLPGREVDVRELLPDGREGRRVSSWLNGKSNRASLVAESRELSRIQHDMDWSREDESSGW